MSEIWSKGIFLGGVSVKGVVIFLVTKKLRDFFGYCIFHQIISTII